MLVLLMTEFLLKSEQNAWESWWFFFFFKQPEGNDYMGDDKEGLLYVVCFYVMFLFV